jgi:hypothetical protein
MRLEGGRFQRHDRGRVAYVESARNGAESRKASGTGRGEVTNQAPTNVVEWVTDRRSPEQTSLVECRLLADLPEQQQYMDDALVSQRVGVGLWCACVL